MPRKTSRVTTPGPGDSFDCETTLRRTDSQRLKSFTRKRGGNYWLGAVLLQVLSLLRSDDERATLDARRINETFGGHDGEVPAVQADGDVGADEQRGCERVGRRAQGRDRTGQEGSHVFVPALRFGAGIRVLRRRTAHGAAVVRRRATGTTATGDGTNGDGRRVRGDLAKSDGRGARRRPYMRVVAFGAMPLVACS